VVDPKDLVLVQRTQDASVELACRVQAVAERLLDHHSAPEPLRPVMPLALRGELRVAELLHHGPEEPVGDREIEDGIALCAMVLFCRVESAAKLLVQCGARQVALDIRHPVRKTFPCRLVDAVNIELRGGIADEALQHVVKMVAPALRGSSRRATPISANFSGRTLVRERL
jgi:hypothetical protein